jgi:hypothetical protein
MHQHTIPHHTHPRHPHRRPAWHAPALLVLVVLLGFLIVSPAAAWRPTPLDVPAVPKEHNRFAFVDVDASGTVHATWLHDERISEEEVVLYLYYIRGVLTSDRTGVVWEENQQLVEEVDANSNPRLAVDEDGTVHLIYGADKDILYIQNPLRGEAGAWAQPELIATTTNGFHSLTLALDSAAIPVVAWCEGVGLEAPSVVNYSYREAPNVWALPTIISPPAYLVDNARMVVQGTGDDTIIHIIYTMREQPVGNPVIGYSNVFLAGNYTFSNLSFDFEQDYGLEPDIALDTTSGILYMAFTRSHGNQDSQTGAFGSYSLLFSYSTDDGRSWESDYATIRSDRGVWFGQPSMVAHNGIIYMVGLQKTLHTDSIVNDGIYYQRINAADPQNITHTMPEHIGEEDAGTFPYVAGGAGSLVAVWIDDNIIKYNVQAVPALTTEEPNTPAEPAEPAEPPDFPVVGTLYLPRLQ